MPDSRPAAKQLESLLKETDRTAVGLDVSMGGRTFMVAGQSQNATGSCDDAEPERLRLRPRGSSDEVDAE